MRAPEFWRDDNAFARILSPIGDIYGRVARARLDRAAPRAELPTIVVGGLTAGGDGKTPLVLALAARFAALGERPALLTRGYGRARHAKTPLVVDPTRHDARDVGDEALLLARAALTIVGADRAASAKLARELSATVVVLDDGFHSRRLAPDLALIVVDADYGGGNGRCLPAGPLRAPLDAQLACAELVVVVGAGARGQDFAASIVAMAANAGKATVRARFVAERKLDGRVVAFAGIARPEKFARSLVEAGADVVATRWFGDHHIFRDDELAELARLAHASSARLVTTEKDAARIGGDMRERGIDTLPVTLAFDDPPALDAILARALLSRAS